jgi:hypothetical protein
VLHELVAGMNAVVATGVAAGYQPVDTATGCATATGCTTGCAITGEYATVGVTHDAH